MFLGEIYEIKLNVIYIDLNEYNVSRTSVSNNIGRLSFFHIVTCPGDFVYSIDIKVNSWQAWANLKIIATSKYPTDNTTTMSFNNNGGPYVLGPIFATNVTGNDRNALQTFNGTSYINHATGQLGTYYTFKLIRKNTLYTAQIYNNDILVGEDSFTGDIYNYISLHLFEGANINYKNCIVSSL